MGFKRRMQSGLLNGLSSLLIFTSACYGAYTYYQNIHCPYKLVKGSNSYYLLDKKTDRKELITDNFQLGSLEYRLDGIFHESKDKFKDGLMKIKEKYDF